MEPKKKPDRPRPYSKERIRSLPPIVAEDGTSPPVLSEGLARRCKFLLFSSVLPFLGALTLGIAWASGRIHFKALDFGPQVALYVLVPLIVVGIGWFAGLAASRWLRDWTLWQVQHDSPGIWFLPYALSVILWITVRMTMLVVPLVFVLILGDLIWKVVEKR
jgi:hypothetical protein